MKPYLIATLLILFFLSAHAFAGGACLSLAAGAVSPVP